MKIKTSKQSVKRIRRWLIQQRSVSGGYIITEMYQSSKNAIYGESQALIDRGSVKTVELKADTPTLSNLLCIATVLGINALRVEHTLRFLRNDIYLYIVPNCNSHLVPLQYFD